ncbi:MAG TPA: class I SAM-dependent methyltransferase [Elusimicrobiales bacterium]|jgi:cyclopropane fatty-acyl-phospholipid synthase-like methyltransferase|nr:class I SAM-dependent methyltransferase [Elusimicrobiales bacterium]HOL62263.1 class I SAM-dependent methyltransferase [Elusimicrobiales bacterium]HPO95047.1 class I SAM-dependent methyltransferase [Elusimicrobiales bacterium]
MIKNIWKSEEYAKRYNNIYSGSKNEFYEALKILKLNKKDNLVDFGCGNGDFLKLVFRKVNYAVGVDISEAQLNEAFKKFKGVKNIKLFKSDFLSFKSEEVFDKGFARKSLHHLNDVQKAKFFKKISEFFAKGSLFLIYDGIFFDFERKELKKNWKKLISDCENYYGRDWEKKKEDVIFCFKKEYPTGIKDLEKAAENGGFKIIKSGKKSSFYGWILLKKEL